MKLRYLATVVCLALTTVAAHAQNQTQGNFGLYFNPLATRVSNTVIDNSPFSFLGQGSTSNVFYGFDLGGYYDFFHTGSLATGFDVRFSDQHASNAALKNFQIGLRVSGTPFKRPFRPYIQASIGEGSSKAQVSTVHVKKPDYAIAGGVDYGFAKHVDFRIFELGYNPLTTVSSATVGQGGNVAIPTSTLINFSSGLVFRF